MTLSEEAESRLTDIVALQPTKNGDLQERWGLDSGSEVHQYLESELKEYYYRDENSLIRATPEAAELVGMEVEEGVVHVSELQAEVLDVLENPGGESKSVVSVLHGVRGAGLDPEVGDVRSALRSLQDKGIVEVVEKTVPTFQLAVERESIEVELFDEPPQA